jgi:hypothetical protein
MRENQLTSEQLARLEEAIFNLSKYNTRPPLKHLTIYSILRGETWVTRTCHSSDLQVIFNIIGERKHP